MEAGTDHDRRLEAPPRMPAAHEPDSGAPPPVNRAQLPPPRRRRRWLTLLGGLVLLVWFGRFAYVRWTTPPAGYASQAVSDTRAAGLLALDDAINFMPASGQMWQDAHSVHQALSGEWAPARRSEQADMLKRLKSPQLQAALDEVKRTAAAAREELAARRKEHPQGIGVRQFHINSYLLSGTVMLLLGRAHACFHGSFPLQGEAPDSGAQVSQTARLEAGWSDLSSAITLRHVGFHAADDYQTFQPRRELAELAYMAQERTIPPLLAREMIAFLQELDPTEALGSAGVDQVLDHYYTNDGRGNGWLVLSHCSLSLPDLTAPGIVADSLQNGPRSGVWNLFSPLFHGRAAARARLTGYGQSYGELMHLPYGQLQQVLSSSSEQETALSILDGPIIGCSVAHSRDWLLSAYKSTAWQRALTVMVALAAYRYDHAAYPLDLNSLAPDYLAEIPEERLTGTTFVYRQLGADAYLLRPSGSVPGEMSVYSDSWERHIWRPTFGAYTISRPEAP